jgi:hypothetical protein
MVAGWVGAKIAAAAHAAARPGRRGLAPDLMAKMAVKARKLMAVMVATALSFGVLSALALRPASATTIVENGAVLFDHSFANNSLTNDPTTGQTALGAVELPTVPASATNGNSTCLTASGGSGSPPSCTSPSPITSNGSGVLNLTPDTQNQEGAAFMTLGLPTSRGLDVTFDAYQYQNPVTNGADGLSFDLAAVNPATLASPTAVGEAGGDLGYAPFTGTPNVPGLSYGYLGMAMDIYGGWTGTGSDGTGCTADPSYFNNNRYQEQVTVRGPGSAYAGYCDLDSTLATDTGTAITGLTGTTQALSQVPVEVVINPTADTVTTTSNLSVPPNDWEMAFTPYGAVQQTLSGPLPSAALYDTGSWLDTGGIPKDIAFGWVASTGSAEDDHAISNVEVQTLLPMPILDTASTEYGTTVSNGSPVTYVDTPTIQPGSSTEAQAVTVADTLPANVTVTSGGGTGWSCSAPTGSVATGQTISCTTTGSGPWTAGTALPPVYINGVVTSASVTQSELSGTTTSANYVLMSSSDAQPGSTYILHSTRPCPLLLRSARSRPPVGRSPAELGDGDGDEPEHGDTGRDRHGRPDRRGDGHRAAPLPHQHGGGGMLHSIR